MKLSEIRRYPVKSLGGERLDHADVERIGLAGDRRFMVVNEHGLFQTVRDIPAMLQVATVMGADGVQLSHPAHGGFLVPFPDASARRQMVTVWRSEVPARVVDDAINVWLSRVLGPPLQLVYLADVTARSVNPDFGGPDDAVSFADGYPLLLTSAASLADLNGRIAERRMMAGDGMDMLRFRPNVVVAGAEAWEEDTWRIVRIGGVRFRVVKPCDRCIVTTRDPVTTEKSHDNEPLRTLGTFRRNASGQIMFGQNLIPMETGRIQVGDGIDVLERGPSNIASGRRV